MNKRGPHIEEAPPKRTSLYLKIEEVKPIYGFQKIEPKEKVIIVLMSDDNNNKMQNMCTLETWGKPKEMSKNSKHPPPSWKPEPQSC
jgi:hypothetical protein